MLDENLIDTDGISGSNIKLVVPVVLLLMPDSAVEINGI